MKIALFGATGLIGSRILAEALRRGLRVTVVARDPSKIKPSAGVEVVRGDASDAASVARAVKGHDAVLSAVGGTVEVGRDAAAALPAGLAQAGVKRLLFVGGAGSLEVAPGVQLMDAPDFPAEWKGYARAHGDALQTLRRSEGIEWTSLSPAAMITPGERTGHYRVGGDQLLTDAAGESRISAEDYAVAFLDELENPSHLRRRFTVAY